MSQTLNPYLTLDGNCREAMNFYAGALGGTAEFNTFESIGVSGDDADKIAHAVLATPGGFSLMAADIGPGRTFTKGDNVTLSLSGDDEAALRGYWDKLSDGGTVAMPLEKQAWGDVFGYLVDKFGFGWMVNISAASNG